jgi:hypothetical protein
MGVWEGRGRHLEEVLWAGRQAAQLQLQLWPVLPGGGGGHQISWSAGPSQDSCLWFQDTLSSS